MNKKESHLFTLRGAAYLVDLVVVFLLSVPTISASVLLMSLWLYGGDEKLTKAMLAAETTRIFAHSAHALLYFSYFTIAHWYFGRTLGKLFFGLEIRHEGRAGLPFGRSLARSLGYIVSGQIALGLGFLLPFFRQDRRALHDLLCDTDVVHAKISTQASGQNEPTNKAA